MAEMPVGGSIGPAGPSGGQHLKRTYADQAGRADETSFANAPVAVDGTQVLMTISTTRAIPRAYAHNPHAFGRARVESWAIPLNGSQHDLQLAQAQHDLCLRLARRHDPRRARRVSQRFGFSVQRWSEYTLGRAWFTPAAWAAAVTEWIGAG